MSFVRAVATVGGLTLVSRVLGFVRDLLMAGILGAGPVSDALVIALRVPNLFRRLFAEGAFSIAFVPIFASTLASDGKEAAARFAEEAQAALLSILLPLTILAILFMPAVMHLLVWGMAADDPRWDLAIELTRITFPYLTLISIAALQGGVLNALDRYGPFAFAPVLFNVCLIAGLLLTPFFPTAGHAMAWGEFAAGIVQVVWMIGSCRRAGVPLKLRLPSWSPRVKRLFAVMAPAAVGTGAEQINAYIDISLGALLEQGAMTWLYYAQRLYQLPLGVIGVAISTALLPQLARAAKQGDEAKAKELQARALEIGLLLAVPAAAALLVIAVPVLTTLFAHGKFTDADGVETARALVAYAAGIPAYVLAKSLSTGFFARGDTKTPVRFSILTVLLNTGIALALLRPLGHVGIAMATGISAWVNVAMLTVALQRRGQLGIDRRLTRAAPRILLAAAAMGLVLWALGSVPFVAALPRIPNLVLLIAAGLATYGAGILVTGAARIGDLRTMLKRPRSVDPTTPTGLEGGA
ncbi:murein biosynthesis integral membrane protein MurJ [Roseiterribacter gracilis]|uniref:Probable lipid II flippase MurJ n=1 Tax=Roseiterribacter gracilis TaxID=2812848 RepID=A0A8S8XBM1_9PROT|nr:putative lipid II flippase MurJ [Rhodospirillales bacterium TMPK1]